MKLLTAFLDFWSCKVARLFLFFNLPLVLPASVIYGDDDFEGEPLGDFAVSSNSTSYLNTADNPDNCDIVANVSSVGDTDIDPIGQHIEVRGNRNKHFTQAEPMTLVSDGVLSLEVSFKIHFNNSAATNDGRLLYSAAGDFSDTVIIAYFSPSNTPAPENFLLAEDQWYDMTIVIEPETVGGSFTDTAKLRFANDNGSAFGDRIYIDDMVVTGLLAGFGAAPTLEGFRYDPLSGDAEVRIEGEANATYILVEADDLDFSDPDQSPLPLLQASVGVLSENQITTDENGRASVQFNLGTGKSVTFVRAERAQ